MTAGTSDGVVQHHGAGLNGDSGIEGSGLRLPHRTALIIIDVQAGFQDPDWGARNNLQAEGRIADLLAAWRAMGWPVHHVHHASQSPEGKFRIGTPGHVAKPEAIPAVGEPIHVKRVNSAFMGTTLERDLRGGAIGSLVLVGLTTNHCVSTTARMSGNLGFRTIVVSDATAAFARAGLDGRMRPAEEVHSAALSDLQGEFATVMTTSHLEALLQAAA